MYRPNEYDRYCAPPPAPPPPPVEPELSERLEKGLDEEELELWEKADVIIWGQCVG